MPLNESRRSFLSGGALASATAIIGNSAAEAAEKKQDNSKNKKKLKIGAFCVGEYTFWGLWADLLSPKGTIGTDLFNMEISHVWDVNPQKAQEFAAKYGCEVVDKYDGMLGKVDGVVCGGFYEIPWQHKIFRPYIEAGVPTYLSRPWSYRIKDMNEMLELAAKHSTPLMATTVYEHYNEAESLKKKIKNVGIIKCVSSTCQTSEYPGHFHLQYMIMKMFNYNVKKVSLITDDEKKCTYMQDTYLIGGDEKQPPFLCSLYAAPEPYIFYINIIGTEGTETASMPAETNYFFRFAPQLIDIQKTMEGKLYEPFDNIRKKHEVFMTGYYSHIEKGGAPVDVGTVPVEWSPPYWKPGWIDDSMFKK